MGHAVGAFNITSYESLRAVIQAAEGLGRPVIIQFAESHGNFISLEEIGPHMLLYAREAAVPVAVHLDHGASFQTCMKAIRMGFTSVMIDASSKDLETNIRITKEVVHAAHPAGVSVEAELGCVPQSCGGSDAGGSAEPAPSHGKPDSSYTDPFMAKEFVERTDVDFLAVSFGTVHGVYFNTPRLDMERLALIKKQVGIPLVMHGGSGISPEDYGRVMENGISKINYYTYMNRAGACAAEERISEAQGGGLLFDQISLAATRGMKEDVKKAMILFSGR